MRTMTFKVTQDHPLLCQSTRHYYFPLALNSNLTSLFNRSQCAHPYLTSIPDGTEKDGWEQVDLFWCQGVQNIGLSNHKIRSALTCTVLSQCTPVTDGQTDGRTNIMAITRRFFLMNASRANYVVKRINYKNLQIVTGMHSAELSEC